MNDVITFKQQKEKTKISMVTAYDYHMAKIINETEINGILVGDSLGMVFQGNENTLSVTLEEVIYHTKAVKKGITDKLLVADMPFMSYNVSEEQTLANAGRLLKEGGANAVKMEGGASIYSQVKRLTSIGIPVMGHIGLTPQSINALGGFRVQGKNEKSVAQLISDALLLEEAGAFSIVLECIPDKVAEIITQKISIPTIGIGASKKCDGQILVINDILGIDSSFSPKFVKKYTNLNSIISNTLQDFHSEVKQEIFPSKENIFDIDDNILKSLY